MSNPTFPKYGLDFFDVENAQQKIDRQKEFLSTSSFISSNGTCKSLLEVSMSANISERYYAQLVNKVNTLQQAMTNLDLTPIFMTLTLDGWIHHLLNGDYSKFDEDKHFDKLPENDKYGYLKTKAMIREPFDVHDLYMILRWQWDRFSSTKTSRKMRKVSKIGYLFAVEPHDSGAPHAHVLLYVPDEFRNGLKEDFKRIFDAPRNVAQSKRKRRNSKKGLTSIQIANGELNGFQWTLSNPVGYILKYVTKSFMDIKNQAQIDDLQTWYIKNRIVRISMSHTLVPQWVYNKMYPLENDWLYLSDLKSNSSCEWSFEDDYFKFEDFRMNKVLQYNRGLYQYYINGVLEREFGTEKELKENNSMLQPERVITSLVPRPLRHSVTINGQFDFTHKGNLNIDLWQFVRNKIELNFYPISISTITFTSYSAPLSDRRSLNHNRKELVIEIVRPNGFKYKLSNKPVLHRNSYDLMYYFHSLDPFTCNSQHFHLVRNECVKRGLLDGQIQALNDFHQNMNNTKGFNPYFKELDRARAYFSSVSAVNSLVSLQNIISQIGS